MKTASKLSWVFPGMGHYYAGRSGRGILFSGLELTALASVAIFSGSYSDKSISYNATFSYYEVNKYNTEESQEANKAAVIDAFYEKQTAKISLISAGTFATGIWIWNIIDLKRTKSQNYSADNPVSVGINSRGQVEARISF